MNNQRTVSRTDKTSGLKSLAGRSEAKLLESTLLRKVLNGQVEVYGRIFERYQDNAFGLALSYMRNREDALDVVQDAFIKAYQNLARFDLNRAFGPWLMSIVRNLCIDLLRKRKFRNSGFPADALRDVQSRESAESGLVRREVWTVLSRLGPKHREIILLKDYLGYSYLEIADTVEIPLGTVMSRLHQARKRFRQVTSRIQGRRSYAN